jgi:hypothetical protein
MTANCHFHLFCWWPCSKHISTDWQAPHLAARLQFAQTTEMNYSGTCLEINIYLVQINDSKISKVIIISRSHMYIPQQEGMSQNIVINTTITRKKERNRTRVYGQASKQAARGTSITPSIYSVTSSFKQGNVCMSVSWLNQSSHLTINMYFLYVTHR